MEKHLRNFGISKINKFVHYAKHITYTTKKALICDKYFKKIIAKNIYYEFCNKIFFIANMSLKNFTTKTKKDNFPFSESFFYESFFVNGIYVLFENFILFTSSISSQISRWFNDLFLVFCCYF